jgi:hypothetical protein
MLNKGETTNTLRRRIAFANRNQLRYDTDPERHAACLRLILNAIVTWNTRYIQAALDHLRETRPDLVTDDALARLAPVPARPHQPLRPLLLRPHRSPGAGASVPAEHDRGPRGQRRPRDPDPAHPRLILSVAKRTAAVATPLGLPLRCVAPTDK